MKRRMLFMVILIIILCSTNAIAQTDYYYYKGNKIPLLLNENKVCLSISKDRQNTIKRILANVKVLKRIEDDDFDIIVILQSEFERLTTLDSWKEDSKSVILSHCYFTTDETEVYATPYLNIRLQKEQDIDLLSLYSKQYGIKIVKQDPLMPLWYILAVNQDCDMNTVECANRIWESGKFAASVPDLCSDDMTCSNDSMFTQQWGLQNSIYTGIDISASDAWNYATGNHIKIAILDTGVDMTHIDLASNISNLSYDAETSTSPSVVYRYHGTKCAGIAAAVKDNSIHIAGVAPEAKIVSISVNIGSSTNIALKLADGITWAYQNGVDIISNSWHVSGSHTAIDEAIQNAFLYGRQGKGCVIVFASGNGYSNNVSYPANSNDKILAVGAIDKTGARAAFSNYGTTLDLVAPGVDILSTYPVNQTASDSGTSMACPHVAGVAALILELNPELTVNQVNSIINSHAKKLSGVNFNVNNSYGLWNNEYGYGLVDAYSSVINTPSLVYIQNDTITGTSVISEDYIYVGSDVTDRIDHGDVILGPGNITLKAERTVIKNSTTVPLGTTLTIEN